MEKENPGLLKSTGALFRLIRWPDLLIIILTQYLLMYAVIKPFLFADHPSWLTGNVPFMLLVTATVFIAAGGYIINDFRDVDIDSVNHPGKNVLEKFFSERSVFLFYYVFNILGILAGAVLSIILRSLPVGLLFPFIAGLLWLYSLKYKEIPALGNIIVAFLTAMVVFVVWYFEFLQLRLTPEQFSAVLPDLKTVNRIFTGYAVFAFLITFFREIIKDMEDKEGDLRSRRLTIPMALGQKRTTLIVFALILLTLALMAFSLLILGRMGHWSVFGFLLVTVVLPLIYLSVKVFFTKSAEDYHFLSNICKMIMVTGVLSMQLLSF
ncbi:MAG: geranylgeranylglycerol-phosphate geranylgeranyltransferase [Bacteroidota bacterium]|nr:geranylgeranylglycerol-phosphate geranylgeranyltransferase [Bacteroidota bacterium]